jgi:FkbM family methyltransferase
MNARSVLKGLLPPVLANALGGLSARLGFSGTATAPTKIKYRIKDLDLTINSDHALPKIRQAHPLYDQFLPFLASRLSAGWVVDIGANVGDTLYALIQSCECRFLCVEPDELYFDLLVENVSALSPSRRNRVVLENAFISSRPDAKTTVRANGTAAAVPASGREGRISRSVALGQLVRERQIPPSEIVLVKVDTDGFDADCLLSIGESWKEMSPLVYWEHSFEKNEQCQEFARLFPVLSQNGYQHFHLFDSAGVPICRGDAQVLREHHDFLISVRNGLTTIARNYYMDVLACKADQRNMVDDVVDAYKAAYTRTSVA